MLKYLPRLVYLASEHKPPLPKPLARLLPQGDLIAQVASQGFTNAVLNGSLPAEQLEYLYSQGRFAITDNGNKGVKKRRVNRGSPDEFRLLVGQIVSEELELSKDSLNFTDYLALYRVVHDYVVFGGDELVASEEVVLSETREDVDMPKFNSGFEPLDLVLGGFYQGIITLMGKPGHGKTSLMLTLMEELIRTNQASSVWFYEVEIPMKLMLYKLRYSLKRTHFREDDRLVTGSFTTREIISRIQENPDPDRIIIIDGPDTMAVAGEGKRFALEAIYRDLIRMKQLAKMVVVSSQPRRKDGHLGMESVSEAWAKAQYSDVVIGIHRLGLRGGMVEIMANVPKNRFGIPDREIKFLYDYEDLSWDLDDLALAHMAQEEDW